jgi:hypothetical protein
MRSVDSIDTIHGHPVSPSSIDALSISELSFAGAGEGMEKRKEKEKRRAKKATNIVDSASFIDISDDDSQPIRVLSPHSFPPLPHSRPSTPSEFMPPSHAPDSDRRRRREKIAKLHRFLGSRIPTSLVLGLSDADDALPARDPTVGDARTHYHGRRRSSSAAELKSNWFGPGDRVKEELDEREKAINVRRAVKMEKVIRRGASFLMSFS